MSTWNTASTGSSKSSEKYNLNEHDSSKNILVYQVRGNLGIKSQQELCRILDSNPRLRLARKEIPRGKSRIEVKNRDLWEDEEKEMYKQYPSAENAVASIGLPRFAYWRHLLFGDKFQELYIVSPKSSPENTPNTSPESSQHVSPSSTFPREEASYPKADAHPADQ